jgi:hypothetical protein
MKAIFTLDDARSNVQEERRVLRGISRLTLSSDVSSATPDLKLQWYPMIEKWKQVDEIGALRGHEFTEVVARLQGETHLLRPGANQ